MKQIILKNLLFFAALFIICAINSAEAQILINPFQITSSTTFEDILKYKSENPKITPQILSEKANELLQQKGLNFVLAFDENTCQKILDIKAKQKNKDQTVNLNATLKSVGAEDAKIKLPDVSFDQSECGRCFIKMPLFEFSGKDFITSVESRNIKFYAPANFLSNEVALLTEQNPPKIIRKWQVPFRTAPTGISADGKLLYLELPYAELSDLILIIYDEGGFQFYPRREVDLSAQSIELKTAVPNTASIKFTKNDKTQIVKYNSPCK